MGPRITGVPTRVVLENDLVRLVVVPDLGARVVSLFDRRVDREWLVTGRLPSHSELAAWAAEDAVYGGRVAFGWDECLPTVAPSGDPLDPAEPPLRDHGECWARPAHVALATRDELVTDWSGRWGFRFRRTLSLDDDAVHCQYVVSNHATRDVPLLWAMHPLLDLEPGSRLDLPAVDRVTLSYQVGLPLPVSQEVSWPLAEGPQGPIDLARVGVHGAMAAKLYAAPATGRAAARRPDGSSLELTWDAAATTALGIWLDDGGWPAGEARRQHALEPTTAPSDSLDEAISAGTAIVLRPGERRRWQVRIRLTPAGR